MDESLFLLFNGDIRLAEEQQTLIWENCQNKEEAPTNAKQKLIIAEIYNTEVTYLLQLEILLKFFQIPLSNNGLLAAPAFESVFSNVTQLYNINKELLHAIRSDPTNISDAFITFAPYFKLYSIYAFGYKKALSTLEELRKSDKKLNTFIKNQETRPEVSATLISLLIAPIQRVPRYRLLLQSLLDASQQHPFQQHIQDALKEVEETAMHINRMMAEAEEGQMLIELARRIPSHTDAIVTPGRKILKQGLVRKTSKMSSSQRYLVLFNDSLLICKGGVKGPLTVARLLPLRHVAIEPTLGSSVFRIKCREVELLMYTDTPADGESWIKTISQAVENHMKCRRTLRKDSSKRSLTQRPLTSVRRTTSAILQRARNACRVGARKSGLNRLKRLRRTQVKGRKM